MIVCKRGFSADIVLNGSPIARMLDYNGKKWTRFLLGQGYYLLREDLRKSKPRARCYPPKHGLINWGSASPDKLTIRTLRIIEDLELNWTVILPPNYSGAKPAKTNINLVQGLVPLSPYINACDLYIGIADSTIFEVVYSLLPSIVISMDDNQHLLAYRLDVDKVSCFLGRLSDLTDKDILEALQAVLKGHAQEHFSSLSGYLDGDGVNRVVKEMKLV